MTELRNTCKKAMLKKNDLSSKSFPNILYTSSNHSRLQGSKLPGSKLVKTCTTLEIENPPYEEYTLEYSTYLLRKVQSKLLAENESLKEENIKKCFVSLKLEFEELLNKYLKLNQELICSRSYFDAIIETNKKIENGKKLLKGIKESKFENLLKTLSGPLDNIINKLLLIDIEKKSIEEMFEKNIWGSGCELEECLKKIDSCLSKNKNQISNIAAELTQLKQLWLENLIFKEKFASLFKSIYDEVLESNYSFCTNAVIKAFAKREEKFEDLDLQFDIPELDRFNKAQYLQHTTEISRFESFAIPRSSSTPQPDIST